MYLSGLVKIQLQQQRDRHRLSLHTQTNSNSHGSVVTGSIVETIFFLAAAIFQVNYFYFYMNILYVFKKKSIICMYVSNCFSQRIIIALNQIPPITDTQHSPSLVFLHFSLFFQIFFVRRWFAGRAPAPSSASSKTKDWA